MTENTNHDDGTELGWIRVDGDRLVSDDDVVVLRGAGLGGWMNMENFITGHAANEGTMRAALAAQMQPDAYEAFFDTFLDCFFGPADAAHLASLGMNSVRIPVNYRHFESDAEPFRLLETGFARLDRVIGLLADAGVYSIIDLHAAPGRQNHHWHSDNPTHVPAFWEHPHFQDRVVHLWEALADRYKDRPEVAGYNPLNEPADESDEVLPQFYRRLEGAIRAIDHRHTLFLDGNKYSTDFASIEPLLAEFDNTVLTAHDYALPGITAATEYPGHTRGEFFDRGVVEREFLRRTEVMRRTGTPIWIGEFGPMYPDPSQNGWRLQLLRDQLDIYREHDASWALWTYKDIGLQGIMTCDPDGPYLSLIGDFLERKRLLGADSWGGTDDHVRDVLDPIDERFDRWFPDFQPYPWGRRQHLNVLVRHILFAEPLAHDFARLFRSVDVDRAVELARSFSFDACVERTELSSLLRDELAVVPGRPSP